MNNQRYLTLYSAAVTALLGVMLFTSGGAAGPRQQQLEVLDVQRINIREPDGTLRAVLSGRATLPGAIIRGKEYPHPREQAGMLFYNDEGTESGGLVFDGAKGNSAGSLTFDAYEQDQILQLVGMTQGSRSAAGLMVNDRPQRSIVQDLEEQAQLKALPEPERTRLLSERASSGYYGQQRMFIGKTNDKATIVLADKSGTPRLQLAVSAAGQASIDFLDEQGAVVKSLTADHLN
ncbi:hypothetical protein GCM10017783_01370 [Deinococcus piscis]|uniref:Secreted protein n=1 Tax=Deinococcus piscis TaxID=394230 RepID=A0ABQ3JY07_9DEIO|nr:hypothetical protein [Deinococcus piscis]GHF93187.1 hypothetical protein GCM10017783_01370 [Deinococcus piscis]